MLQKIIEIHDEIRYSKTISFGDGFLQISKFYKDKFKYFEN